MQVMMIYVSLYIVFVQSCRFFLHLGYSGNQVHANFLAPHLPQPPQHICVTRKLTDELVYEMSESSSLLMLLSYFSVECNENRVFVWYNRL